MPSFRTHTQKTSHHVCDLPNAFVTLSMEKAAATNLVLLSEKGQKRGLETRALNTIFTPCSRRTNCWLRLFYHSSLSFWWWNDWEKPFRIEFDLENEIERTICSISKNPFQQILHFNTCNSILVFMKCCINVKFFFGKPISIWKPYYHVTNPHHYICHAWWWRMKEPQVFPL